MPIDADARTPKVQSLLEMAARAFPDHPAVYHGTRPLMSFAELERRANRLAGGLAHRCEPGARVMIAAKNCPAYVEAMFAAWMAGLVIVPVNAKLHPREIAEIAADCDPALIFASPEIGEELAGHLVNRTIVAFGSAAYSALLEGDVAVPPGRVGPGLAWLFYTSGTTGRSKGAMLTHGNLLAMARSHWSDIDLPEAGSTLLHAAPMSHGSGLYILPYLAKGAAQIVPESGGFEPDEVLDICDRVGGAAMFLAPTMLQRLCDAADRRGHVPEGLRLVIYGGGPMYVSDLRRALALMGPRFAQIYGQGESPMTITGLASRDHVDQSDAVLGSVGRARSGIALRIVGEDGEGLPVGEAGEVLCRGDTVMAGYWNMPEATAAALADGWLRTGDVGALDPAGFLTLKDRSKDLVISGGSNIYPREVEEVLIEHPDVTEVCVVGEPDPEWGEIVVAHVARRAGVSDAYLATELDRLCIDRIARFKRPKRYVFHPELPKSAYGKVLKRALRGT